MIPITRLSEVWSALQRRASTVGVHSIGASDLSDPSVSLFNEWLDHGYAAGMTYLERNREVRSDPGERFPWAKSVIVVTVPYSPERPQSPPGMLANGIARYALGDDYHLVLDRILVGLEAELKLYAPDAETRRYVDTGPLSDRSYATRAGLGWIAKNSMLNDENAGSYLFVATLLTSLENDLTVDSVADRCGTCTRCIDACPTAAILPGRVVDSNRCISYLTIEHRGVIADELKDQLGDNIFGCDICQEVCPWNGRAIDSHPDFLPREIYGATPVTDLLRASQSDFSQLFQQSAVKRAKRSGMIRNALLTSPIETRDLSALETESDAGIRDALAWGRTAAADEGPV